MIASRLDRLVFGHTADVASVGEGISGLRIHYGPGCRIYFQRRDDTVVILLCGGDKAAQARDNRTAKRLAQEWMD